jgi:hypothetical protein
MMKLERPWLRGAVLAGLALRLVGCGGGSKGGGTGPATADVGPPPQAVPIRRLTNAEYLATVADLFPGFTLPEINFLTDAKVLGFTNLSSSQTGNLVWAEQHEARGELVCAQPYLFDLAKRAYRRPVTDEEKQALTTLLQLNQDNTDYQTRLWLTIEGILLSPKFVFRPELGDAKKAVAKGVPLTNWEVATRLSYLITGSTPDPELTASADTGKLATPVELKTQAQRLLGQARSQDHLARFHEQWLGVDTVSAMTKNPISFPTFSGLLAAEMAQETRTFLKNVVFAKQGTFADLFLANYTYADAKLAQFYGAAPPATDWDRVELDPSQRSGLLTQGSLLATLAKDTQTDPVRRGKFVLNQILCQNISPPPPDVVAKFQPMDLSKTAREQFAQHRVDAVCATCHNTLDPLGLPFEHYDGIGKWRDDDRGMAIDATGAIEGTAFDGIPQLAQLVVDNPETRACYVSEWFRFNSGKLNGDVDQPYLDWLSSGFRRDTKVIDLVITMVQSDSFRYLMPDPTAGSAP